jgi:hypothetical protein
MDETGGNLEPQSRREAWQEVCALRLLSSRALQRKEAHERARHVRTQALAQSALQGRSDASKCARNGRIVNQMMGQHAGVLAYLAIGERVVGQGGLLVQRQSGTRVE